MKNVWWKSPKNFSGEERSGFDGHLYQLLELLVKLVFLLILSSWHSVTWKYRYLNPQPSQIKMWETPYMFCFSLCRCCFYCCERLQHASLPFLTSFCFCLLTKRSLNKKNPSHFWTPSSQQNGKSSGRQRIHAETIMEAQTLSHITSECTLSQKYTTKSSLNPQHCHHNQSPKNNST